MSRASRACLLLLVAETSLVGGFAAIGDAGACLATQAHARRAPITACASPFAGDSPHRNRRHILSAAALAASASSVRSVSGAELKDYDATDEMKRPNIEISGYYSDPTHPRGFRQIIVNGKSNNVVVRGADDKFETRWKLQASVSGNSITLFLESGGKVQPPSGVQSTRLADGTVRRTFTGTYNPSRPAGIEWPDGNKWTKSDGDDFTF